MLEFILERGNYWAIIGLMMIGLYITFAATNLIKRLVGLGLFQTSIVLFYVSLGRINEATAPILYGDDYKKAYDDAGQGASDAVSGGGHGAGGEYGPQVLENLYSNPLPHVLMLTAIVVGVATLAVGLAITVRMREAYGTVEMDEVRAMDLEVAFAEAADDAEETQAAAGAV